MTKSAAAAEALGESIPFTFQGESFSVQPSSEWGFDALEDYENGRILRFLSQILDEDAWAKLRALKPKASVVGEFVLAVQKAVGIAGN
jgi:hypothetical protein